MRKPKLVPRRHVLIISPGNNAGKIQFYSIILAAHIPCLTILPTPVPFIGLWSLTFATALGFARKSDSEPEVPGGVHVCGYWPTSSNTSCFCNHLRPGLFDLARQVRAKFWLVKPKTAICRIWKLGRRSRPPCTTTPRAQSPGSAIHLVCFYKPTSWRSCWFYTAAGAKLCHSAGRFDLLICYWPAIGICKVAKLCVCM